MPGGTLNVRPREDEAPRPPARSISDGLGGTHNSLGLIRLVLALIVIVDHAFPLGGFRDNPIVAATQGQASLGTLAVGGFFGISGYLIAKSGSSSDVLQFMWRRILRIFPAYWVVLGVTAFVVGPALWVAEGRGLADYFSLGEGGPFYYITSNWTLSIGTYGIHHLLAETPYGLSVDGSVFNGSLWTLVYEWNCYLIIAVLVAFGVLKNARMLVPIMGGFFLLLQVVNGASPNAVGAVLPQLADPAMINFGLTFLIGSAIAIYSKQVPYDDRLGALAGATVLITLRYGGFSTVGTVAGVYFVLYLGARLPKRLRWIGAKNDYSYGVYIYGFLVQQVVAYVGLNRLGYVPYVLICLALAFVCAWLSWHLVEKRALQLKDWGPGKGLRDVASRARSTFTSLGVYRRAQRRS